jgi:hypothetical protein
MRGNEAPVAFDVRMPSGKMAERRPPVPFGDWAGPCATARDAASPPDAIMEFPQTICQAGATLGGWTGADLERG